MTRVVLATIRFPIPEREDGIANELVEFWEQNGDDIDRISREIKELVEDEHGGLAEYQTVVVTNVRII